MIKPGIRKTHPGMIGRISLETPAMMEQELIELAIIREEKEAKKKARKLKSKGSN